jgi:hypothetical protein
MFKVMALSAVLAVCLVPVKLNAAGGCGPGRYRTATGFCVPWSSYHYGAPGVRGFARGYARGVHRGKHAR